MKVFLFIVGACTAGSVAYLDYGTRKMYLSRRTEAGPGPGSMNSKDQKPQRQRKRQPNPKPTKLKSAKDSDERPKVSIETSGAASGSLRRSQTGEQRITHFERGQAEIEGSAQKHIQASLVPAAPGSQGYSKGSAQGQKAALSFMMQPGMRGQVKKTIDGYEHPPEPIIETSARLVYKEAKGRRPGSAKIEGFVDKETPVSAVASNDRE